MELKALICPQCGSADVSELTAIRCRCNSCGSIFLIETDTVDDALCRKRELPTVQTPREFLRSVWLCIARSDPPDAVFSCDASEVAQRKREVLVSSAEGRMTVRASVGYDREETYLETERRYDSETESYRDFPVTKKRTVTDWQAFSTSVTDSVCVAVSNDKEATPLSAEFSDIPENAGNACGVGAIVPEAQDSAMELQAMQLRSGAKYCLPGDRHKDVQVDFDSFSVYDNRLYSAEEYQASVQLGEKLVSFTAYPFRKAGVSASGSFDNPDGIAGTVAAIKISQTARIRRKTRPILLASVISLCASILVSLLLRSIAMVLLFFALALGLFIVSEIRYRKIERSVQQEIAAECDAATANHTRHLLTLLNGKLTALGLPPAAADEL